MSLGIQEILQEEKNIAMDHGVWAGAVGSLAGYLLANQMQWSTSMTAASVLGGHFAGHSVAAQLKL